MIVVTFGVPGVPLAPYAEPSRSDPDGRTRAKSERADQGT